MSSSPVYFTAVHLSQVGGYLTTSAVTFILCDVVSALDDEVKFIWRSKRTWAKALYLISRYLGPITLLIMINTGNSADPLSERRRIRIHVASTFGCWAAILVVNVISSMRIYALYNRSNMILILVLVLSACELAIGTYSSALILIDFTRVLRSFPALDVVSELDVDAVLLYGFQTFVGLDSASKTKHARISALVVCTVSSMVYLTLSLVKLRESITDTRGKVRYEVLTDPSYAMPLAAVFISDGAFAFLLILGIELATTIISLDNIAYYYAPTFAWRLAIFSYVGSRLILNLRRAGGRGIPTPILKRDTPAPLCINVRRSTYQEGQYPTDDIDLAIHTELWRDPDPFSA